MKRLGLLIFLCLGFSACNKYKNDQYISYITSDSSLEYLNKGRYIYKIQNDILDLIYHLNGSKKDPVSFKNTASPGKTQNGPKLQFDSIEGNVLYVRVINADYLTQRMGSAGAEYYLATATFTLTEHPDIQSVFFDFPEGDHASPGHYTRADFLDHLKIKKQR